MFVLRSRRQQALTMVLPLPGDFICAIVQGNSDIRQVWIKVAQAGGIFME